MADLAKQLGVSQKEAKTASAQVITSLLGGMTANAQNSSGEKALASALVQHRGSGKSFAAKGVQLSDIDTKDGAKIVQHALGATPAKTATALAKKTGTDKSLLQKLLPILAPVVIAYIADTVVGSSSKKSSGQGSSDVVTSIVGGLMGGGGTSSTSSDVVGAVVDGILGGSSSSSKKSSNSGDLGSLLGGLLGGALGSNTQASKAKKTSGGVLGGLLDALF